MHDKTPGFVPHLCGKHMLLHRLRDEEYWMIETVLCKTERWDDDGGVVFLTVVGETEARFSSGSIDTFRETSLKKYFTHRETNMLLLAFTEDKQ